MIPIVGGIDRMTMEREKLHIWDIPVDKVDRAKAMAIFDEMMAEPGCSMIVTPNSEIVMNASKDDELADLIREAELVIPDGIGLVYASKILGQPLNERVTGIDFADAALQKLAKEGKSVFFFGSKPDGGSGVSVAQMAAEKKMAEYPGLVVSGMRDGYFKPEDEDSIVAQINASGAELLLVAMGSPKQEKFIQRHRGEFQNVRAAIGIGGSLDVWAGTLKRAPEFYQKHGLEWLYRLIQEPSRYKRMAALPLFMMKVVMTKGRKKNGN